MDVDAGGELDGESAPEPMDRTAAVSGSFRASEIDFGEMFGHWFDIDRVVWPISPAALILFFGSLVDVGGELQRRASDGFVEGLSIITRTPFSVRLTATMVGSADVVAAELRAIAADIRLLCCTLDGETHPLLVAPVDDVAKTLQLAHRPRGCLVSRFVRVLMNPILAGRYQLWLCRYGIKVGASEFLTLLHDATNLMRDQIGIDATRELFKRARVDFGTECHATNLSILFHPATSVRNIPWVVRSGVRDCFYSMFGTVGGGFGGVTLPVRPGSRWSLTPQFSSIRCYPCGWWHAAQAMSPPPGMPPRVTTGAWLRMARAKFEFLVHGLMAHQPRESLGGARVEFCAVGVDLLQPWTTLLSGLQRSLETVLPHLLVRVVDINTVFDHIRDSLQRCDECNLFSGSAMAQWQRLGYERLASICGIVCKFSHMRAWDQERRGCAWRPQVTALPLSQSSVLVVPSGFDWSPFPVVVAPPCGPMATFGTNVVADVSALLIALNWPLHLLEDFRFVMAKVVFRRNPGRRLGQSTMLAATLKNGGLVCNLGDHFLLACATLFARGITGDVVCR